MKYTEEQLLKMPPWKRKRKEKAQEETLTPLEDGIHYLGKLCPRGHEYQDTGKSLRYWNDAHCVRCNTERQRVYYQKKKAEATNV